MYVGVSIGHMFVTISFARSQKGSPTVAFTGRHHCKYQTESLPCTERCHKQSEPLNASRRYCAGGLGTLEAAVGDERIVEERVEGDG